jgi:hypothetical protein
MAVGASTTKPHVSGGFRTFLLVIAIACVPVVGTVLAIVSTTEPDLSDLISLGHPQGQYQRQYVLLNWYALRQGRFSAGASIQALGYMVGNDRAVHTGDSVREFALLPEAGNILHPAHQIPDQTIEVHLREGEPIEFSPRSLVWVWGKFRASPPDAAGLQPLYHLDEARARPAAKSEISTYFK